MWSFVGSANCAYLYDCNFIYYLSELVFTVLQAIYIVLRFILQQYPWTVSEGATLAQLPRPLPLLCVYVWAIFNINIMYIIKFCARPNESVDAIFNISRLVQIATKVQKYSEMCVRECFSKFLLFIIKFFSLLVYAAC